MTSEDDIKSPFVYTLSMIGGIRGEMIERTHVHAFRPITHDLKSKKKERCAAEGRTVIYNQAISGYIFVVGRKNRMIIKR